MTRDGVDDPTTPRHWRTLWDDDGTPYGELCTCGEGEDHFDPEPECDECADPISECCCGEWDA